MTREFGSEGRRTKSHLPSRDIVLANLDQYLTPAECAGMIREVMIKPGSQTTRTILVADLGCNERCMHYDCGRRVPARIWDIARHISEKDSDGSVFGSEPEGIIKDGLLKVRVTEVGIHGMEVHGRLGGTGSLTGEYILELANLSRVLIGI